MRDLAKFVMFLFCFGFLFFTSQSYKNNVFSVRFLDEEYNLAIGKYLNRGEILYDDIVTNHQPVTHLLSGLLQKKQNPDTTSKLIEGHRLAIINWSVIWSIILVFYFGLVGVIFVVIYELTRSHFYGQLFLAETFVVYPLVFLIGLSLFRKIPLKAFELFAAGVLLGFLTLTLGPMWPAILFLTCLLVFQQLKGVKDVQGTVSFKKSLILGFLGAILFFLLVLPKVNIPGYFDYYIFGNLENMVPHTREYWLASLPQSFFSPLLSFKGENPSDNLLLIRTLSVLLILNLMYFTFKKKFQLVAAIFILLGLLNIRFIQPGAGHANGFHLLPWYAALIFIASALFVKQLKTKSFFLFKLLGIGVLVVAFFFSFKYANHNLFVEKNAKKDYETFFSTHTKIGESLKSLKKDEDTLFIFPDAWLVYWQSDAKHLPKLFGYYTWMAGIPKLRGKVNEAFANSPPTFYYCEGCQYNDLKVYLEKYAEVKGYEGKQNLFILKSLQ